MCQKGLLKWYSSPFLSPWASYHDDHDQALMLQGPTAQPLGILPWRPDHDQALMLQRPIPQPLCILPWRPWPSASCLPFPRWPYATDWMLNSKNQPSSLTLQDPLLEIRLSGHVSVSKGLKQNLQLKRQLCEAPLRGPCADRLLLIQKGGGGNSSTFDDKGQLSGVCWTLNADIVFSVWCYCILKMHWTYHGQIHHLSGPS